MSLEEKLAQKSGSGLGTEGAWWTPRNDRLGMRGLAMIDVPRGVGKESGSNTAFPVAMARGATWNPELEREVDRAIGLEARARGASVLLAPCINMLRHPSSKSASRSPVYRSRPSSGMSTSSAVLAALRTATACAPRTTPVSTTLSDADAC